MILWRRNCLSYKFAMVEEAARSYSSCSNKIKMPKTTTTYQIKSFIPTEKVNVEKLRLNQNQHK